MPCYMPSCIGFVMKRSYKPIPLTHVEGFWLPRVALKENFNGLAAFGKVYVGSVCLPLYPAQSGALKFVRKQTRTAGICGNGANQT